MHIIMTIILLIIKKYRLILVVVFKFREESIEAEAT
jgi:hypothetical protein